MKPKAWLWITATMLVIAAEALLASKLVGQRYFDVASAAHFRREKIRAGEYP